MARSSRVWPMRWSTAFAAVMATASSRPRVSTTVCRLRPGTFFAPSNPLVALGMVGAARTDWASMEPAVGSAGRFADFAAQPVVQLGAQVLVASAAKEGVDGRPGRSVESDLSTSCWFALFDVDDRQQGRGGGNADLTWSEPCWRGDAGESLQ